MRIKFLQLKAMLFGGDVVYLKIVSDKNQLYAAIACVQWDPFDQDTRPVIHVDHCNFYLDPDGTFGPVYYQSTYLNKDRKDRKDLWKYVSKNRQVEHVLKTGS